MEVGLTVNVLALVGGDITSGKFTVGGLGGAIASREIVDDESTELVARNSSQIGLKD